MKFVCAATLLLARSVLCFTTQRATSDRTWVMTLNEAEDEAAAPEIEMEQEVVEEPENPFLYKAAAPNGWVPDSKKPCFGLPGVVAPTGYFDPIGFCQTGISLNDVKRYRESEVMHGRVAMLAVVGYLVGESFGGPFGLSGPANDQLAQLPLPVLLLFGAAMGAAELKRATIGWVEPTKFKSLWALRESYYPGDVGFDPLGLKPTDPEKFSDMQTRELQNGRLAMIGVAGFCSQELVNHKTILDTIDFYQKVYSGVNPYDY